MVYNTNYKLALIEFYNKDIHGHNVNLFNQLVVEYIFDEYYNQYIDEQLEASDMNTINDESEMMELYYNIRIIRQNYIQHEYISNYNQIIRRHSYFYPKIVCIINLPTNECIAIDKTCFLRIFQRKCRNFIERKKKIIIMMKSPKNIRFRKKYGKFPPGCYL